MEDGYQPAGSPRHWLLRQPDEYWQVAAAAIITAILLGLVFFAVYGQAAVAVVTGAALGILFGTLNSLRLWQRLKRHRDR